jgi:hypothetical protein
MYKLTIVFGLMLGAWLARSTSASADPDPADGSTKACYDSCDQQLGSCYDACFDTGAVFEICQMGCDMANDMCIVHCLPKPPGPPPPPPICIADSDCATGSHCAGGICVPNGGGGPKQGPGDDCSDNPDETCPEDPDDPPLED